MCEELLAAADGVWFTTHINENGAEVDQVATYFPGRAHYLDTYHHHGLITDRSVLAHNVHATDHELEVMADDRAPGPRTARPATPRWAAGCSRSGATSRTASVSPWAPTSAPAPGSACSRRACRPTSPSSSSGPTGYR